jgi:hypothetical protein
VPVQEFDRRLTDDEKREVARRLERLRSMVRFSLLKAFAASVLVCGALAILTLLASDAPRPLIIFFWAVLAALFTLWIGVPGRAGRRRQAATLEAALRHDRGRVFRVQSSRLVEFEELEDEGACYAFDIGEGRILFVQGQEFYADETFPNSDFSLVTVLGPGTTVVDEIFTKSGAKLEPERRIARDVKERLTIPDHLEVIDADLATIEASLPPAENTVTRASGRRRDRR